MELNDRVTQLEDEIKILKNEVQAVLLDLRESYLNQENPFNPNTPQIISSPPIIINQPPPAAREEPDKVVPEADSESKLAAVEEIVPEPEPTIEPELAGEPEVTEEPKLTAEPEPVDEPALSDEPESIASAQTAQEEVKRVWRPVTELEPYLKSGEATGGLSGKIDLATIAGLTEWVAEAVKRFGHERTEAILDITEMMGHMAPELKDILVKFINPISGEFSDRVTTQDFLASLIKLGGLLGKDNKSEIALLYMLCQEDGHR